MDLLEYINCLKRYPDFRSDSEHNLPPFIYGDPRDKELKNFSSRYGLRSIAGSGDSLSKIQRLMKWVHDELTDSGELVNIDPLTVENIIETRRQKGCALFCIHKAAVLTEALLAVGIKARLLTCLPFTFDYDRHVVTMAFIPEMRRWAVFDPTFNTYFYDSNGLPLSIVEIRNSYKENRIPAFRHISMEKRGALVMNSVEYRTYDAWYSVYMAKNCFRFYCPLVSEYGQLTKEHVKYVFLNPTGYDAVNEYDEAKDIACRTDNIRYFLI